MNKLMIIILFILYVTTSSIYSQEVRKQKFYPDNPVLFTPKKHESNFKILKKLSEKSFYDSKPEWQHIIDSTWGPGDSLSRKLLIFNTYAKQVHDKFDGFISLNLNWDSLYSYYLNKITDSTSRGAFSAIMSHFAYDLKDLHTRSYDSSVVYVPLNPGVPVLLLGSYITVEHFGAVTTVLPDSTTLVLRVVPNHPLGLEPGDIILGYEGIPWKDLVRELLNANIPLVAATGGCKTADTYLNLSGVGLNWHLFNTIDILKYSTGDTVHLSVLPLLDLNVPPPMVNNEQLPIPNIPFPNLGSDQFVTYGILENTNIGYIYLSYELYKADASFYEAVKYLRNTDALIIDMRYNGGGWEVFDSAFNILFNESYRTVEDAYRCNDNNYTLCQSGNGYLFQIKGVPSDFYDKPIAVLLGPTCVSMGDVTAQRLKYHKMVRFFGASSSASLGTNLFIHDFPGWFIWNSISDMFHINNPDIYLNRREFPIDFPVWFNKDNVASGKDDVVEKALEWVNNLVYGHSLTKNTTYCRPGIDTLKISALVENPNSHQISSKVYFKNLEGSFIDSLELTKTGLNDSSETWIGNYLAPDSEDIFSISVNAKDIDESKTWNTDNISRFTTAGPVILDSISINKSVLLYYVVKTYIKNESKSVSIENASVKLISNDPWVTRISSLSTNLSNINPGSTVGSSSFQVFRINSIFPGYFNFKVEIMSDGWVYWTDSMQVQVPAVGISEQMNVPLTFKLEQNYPNPFNPTTTIKYSIPKQSFVTLKVYDILGKEIEKLVNEEKQAGSYQINWNAAKLSSGVYFYQIKAGEFIQAKKMILMK